MTVTEFLRRLEGLDIKKLVKKTITVTEEEIIEENQDQMIQGIRADGTKISPPYAESTRKAKIRKGRNPNVVSLYDKGGFYNAMHIEVKDNEFEIESNSKGNPYLQEKYGEEIFGLTDESKNEYINVAEPILLNEIRNMLKL